MSPFLKQELHIELSKNMQILHISIGKNVQIWDCYVGETTKDDS